MALEDLTGVDKFIDDLINTNPAAGDLVSVGDDHLRGIKNVLANTFPNVDAAVNPSPAEFNRSVGVTENIQPALDNANAALAAVQALDPKQQPTIVNAADTDHDLTMSTGFLLFTDAAFEFTSALTKQIDAVWAAGNNAGGRAAGVTLANDQTGFIGALTNSTRTIGDWAYDTDIAGSNALADANVIAAGHTVWKPWLPIKLDGSQNIRPFTISRTATSEDLVLYDTEVTNLNINNLSLTGTTFEDSCPDGIFIGRYMRFGGGTGTSANDEIFAFSNASVTYTSGSFDSIKFPSVGTVGASTIETMIEQIFYSDNSTFAFDVSAGANNAQGVTLGYTFNRQEL